MGLLLVVLPSDIAMGYLGSRMARILYVQSVLALLFLALSSPM